MSKNSEKLILTQLNAKQLRLIAVGELGFSVLEAHRPPKSEQPNYRLADAYPQYKHGSRYVPPADTMPTVMTYFGKPKDTSHLSDFIETHGAAGAIFYAALITPQA